jgi:hypothetical protein
MAEVLEIILHDDDEVQLGFIQQIAFLLGKQEIQQMLEIGY